MIRDLRHLGSVHDQRRSAHNRKIGNRSSPSLRPHVSTMHLSKSRFVAGLQCHRLLWWKVHEPGAVELQPDKVLQDRFDQGAQVGALARERFAGGTLIDAPHHEFDTRVALTERALESGAPTIFEASFFADDTFVAADVLTRVDGEWHLIEAK